MAQFNKGILGGFSGKVGTVVGVNWRGLNVMRSLPAKKKRIASSAQATQRAKFALAARFLAPLRPVTAKYYGSNQGARSRTNMAMSHQLAETITEIGENQYAIDYSKVVLAKGDLPQVAMDSIAFADNTLTFAWKANENNGAAQADDRVVFIIYSKLASAFVLVLDNTYTRSSERASIALPPEFVAADNEIWVIAVADDETTNSTSNYIGVY